METKAPLFTLLYVHPIPPVSIPHTPGNQMETKPIS